MSEKPPEPNLDPVEIRQLRQAIEEFNSGKFFECHDTLEEVWSGIRGPAREFFQGLIQVSVGFYHFGNANRGGALTMLERGLKRLARYPERYGGLDLRLLRREVAEWRARIEAGEGFPEDLDRLPKYRLAPDDDDEGSPGA